MDNYLSIIIRLVLAGVLGGVIGYEREHSNRPAGFRTHILVCVGSALVMITSEFIFRTYTNTNADPARLGAQVISGIGFLGAGTIIREGINVKGLTTAASLWAVACVGIAAGIGFYEGAIGAAAIIFITLITLKRMEISLGKKWCKTIYIRTDNAEGKISQLSGVFEKHEARIRTIEFVSNENDSSLLVKFKVKLLNTKKAGVISDLSDIKGICEVYEE